MTNSRVRMSAILLASVMAFAGPIDAMAAGKLGSATGRDFRCPTDRAISKHNVWNRTLLIHLNVIMPVSYHYFHQRHAHRQRGDRRECIYVSRPVLPNGGCCCGGYERQCRHRTNLCPGFVKTLHSDAGRDLDNKAMGGGKEDVGQGQGKMGRLPEAVERSETQRSEELVVSLPMYDELGSDWSSNVRAWVLNGGTRP